MKNLTYAIITPSYYADYERCKLLVETVKKFIPDHVIHYLVIDKRDIPLFEPLTDKRTKILVVENITPWWISRIPGVKKFWWSWRSIPIKNWILQQIVKLSVANEISQDVLLFVDSDVFFVKPFDPKTLEKDGKVPLFMELGQIEKSRINKDQTIWFERNDTWHQVAAKLIGLAPEAQYDTNFIGNIIPWRKENVIELHKHLTKINKRNWVLTIANKWMFSEYVLYGLYITQSKLEESGHYHDGIERTACYWDVHPLDEKDLLKIKNNLTTDQHSVMISAKSPTPVDRIRKVFITDSNGSPNIS